MSEKTSLEDSRLDPRQLPPLAMLRAFEATARHASMTRAATELNVTHGAVSRQILALERFLGMLLFHRRARGVQLTDEGTRLFHGVNSGFERIRTTIRDLKLDCVRRPVTITTVPSFAARWLMPQLAKFQFEFPAIPVVVRTSTDLDNLCSPAFDCAIRYGAGNWPNTAAEILIEPELYPVCSPAFLAKRGPLRSPASLMEVPLVHDVTKQWWIDWFVAAGVHVPGLSGGIVVDDYGLAVQFAIDGHGAALGIGPLIDRELQSGALIRLFDIAAPCRFSYYLARDAAKQPHPDANVVMRWLKAHASDRPVWLFQTTTSHSVSL